MPRGGERSRPNPIFLAHAAALTELYVTLQTEAGTLGLSVQEYRREGQARELFDSAGKERALAPDAMVILVDGQSRQFGAFVEIDLGTMSHTRLRQKAELYAAYAASEDWRGRHLFLPALLFLTTTDARAAKFVGALGRALSYGPRQHGRHAFVAGAAGVAWTPGRLLRDACLEDLDGNVGLTLIDVLEAAREPYEQVLAYRRECEEAEDARRRVLRDDPEAMRKLLADYTSGNGSPAGLGSCSPSGQLLTEARPSELMSTINRFAIDSPCTRSGSSAHPSTTTSAESLGRIRSAGTRRRGVRHLRLQNFRAPPHVLHPLLRALRQRPDPQE
ncbi:MAG: replication-relaxation family protein [Solirubrobacteraceae bacterium]